MFPQNNARVVAQNALDIRVIVGNSPYSSGQTSQNDSNQNQKYPTLDSSMAATYAARSTATLKNSLYDSYIRAIRWASDRIGASKQGGVIGFVTNGGFIDGNTADGLRKTLVGEFDTIYCFNLRGNARTGGDLRQREAGNVFGSGSRSTVAITLLVRKPGSIPRGRVLYRDIGDYLSGDAKLEIISTADVATATWSLILPSADGDWINQRSGVFNQYLALGDKNGGEVALFNTYSGGLKSNRDAWVYNSASRVVRSNVGRMIDFYNRQVSEFSAVAEASKISDPAALVDTVVDLDPAKFSWDRADRARLVRGVRYSARSDAVVKAAYRPFCKQHVYFDRQLNNTVYQLPKIFPAAGLPNMGIYNVGAGSAVPFSVLMVDSLPDLHLTGAGSNGQFFPRYTYRVSEAGVDLFSEADADTASEGWSRLDNISAKVLEDYRTAFGDEAPADDVFHYTYGVLHAPDYRKAFAADLKKTLPRIPRVAKKADFDAFTEAGRSLAALHLGYESVAPFPLVEQLAGSEDVHAYRVSKMAFGKAGKAPDRTRIVYNSRLTMSGIPEAAYEYQIGARSAIEWIMERYQVKLDKASGIVNDPNDWADEVGGPRYIVDLLKRIVTVSLATVEIVTALPSLDLGQ